MQRATPQTFICLACKSLFGRVRYFFFKKGILIYSQRWAARNYGTENYRLDGSYKDVINELSKGLTIKTDWQVKEINYEDVGAIKLVNQQGEVRTMRCGRLLNISCRSLRELE